MVAGRILRPRSSTTRPRTNKDAKATDGDSESPYDDLDDDYSGDNSDYEDEGAGDASDEDESYRKREPRTDGASRSPPVVDTEPGTLNSTTISDRTTEVYQTNVDSSATTDHLLQDARNLCFSHMPRIPGTSYRFQIGELAYVKWKGELNVVVIHYASQKLVTSKARPKDKTSSEAGNGATDEKETQSSQQRTSSIGNDKGDDGDSSSDSSDSSEEATDERSDEEVEPEPVKKRGTRADRPPRGGRRLVINMSYSGEDVNRKIFRDVSSQRLYEKINELQPLTVRIDKDVPPDILAYDESATKSDEDHVVKRYFVPIYFVTFPGYKKRCAKSFRFWVKEKDLIKFNSVTLPTKKTQKPIIVDKPIEGDCNTEAWATRQVQGINEYVYDVAYNVYRYKSIHSDVHRAAGMSPWCVPKVLKELVQKQHSHITKSCTEEINYYSTAVSEMFSLAPLTERLSAYALVQNFKYVVILLANLIAKKGGSGQPSKNKGECSAREVETSPRNCHVDEVSVPSLRFLDHLQSALSSHVTARQFQEIYVNNIYWLDIYLAYVDKMFIHTHCYNEQEHEFLYMMKYSHKKPLSHILGLEHFARVFCYPVLHDSLLKRVNRGGQPFPVYLPITQLLLQYMAFVSIDYAHNQKYFPSHVEGGLFKISHLKLT
ncbi:uncharacterized protein BXIN_2692 [Babesia sp. Xinjiang]|uniref:uncharacterized protein n=1 Tax=Babesia sp. Xinjiang TaxID=462227 RepID=UPI000A238E48|nr:uncharacterized protein BXIN_2628 [Babesia sp. Xinjiang]XP_028872105.1 uncharacterized protein BXIN_2692 [Babesia sp. Xinjiang]ORM41550.1 hypothetical protein BXIN_2628 [Babesia sp. Xinjiang]ORM41649.1 hypothetical protein BXIN_2692 [Babesia sp. Xinjiang]